MLKTKWSRGSGTIKARVLAIALIPSIAIMIVGVGLAAYLVDQGVQTRTFADNVRSALGPTSRFIVAVQEERRLTTRKVTGLGEDHEALVAQRRKVDAAVIGLAATSRQLAESAPDELREPLEELDKTAGQLPALRERVDTGKSDAQGVYETYSKLVALVGEGIQGVALPTTPRSATSR